MAINTNNSISNTSDGSSFRHPASECVPWLVVLTIECLAIVILNIITFIVLVTEQQLKRQNAYLPIRNLAIVDLLAGAISGPLQIERVGGEDCDVWEYYPGFGWVDHLKFALLHLFSMASLANLAAISLERMHGALRPLQHMTMNKRVYVVIIAVVWLTAVIRESIQIVLYETQTIDRDLEILVNSTLYLPYYFISLFVICLSYVTIFMKIRCNVHSSTLQSTVSIRERKLTVTLFIVTIASILTLLPVIIFQILIHSLRSYFHIKMFVVMFFLANSLANPIIYSMRIQGFRQRLAVLFSKTTNQVSSAELQLQRL